MDLDVQFFLVDESDACGFECAPIDIQGRATRLTSASSNMERGSDTKSEKPEFTGRAK
jgi:hypothetical protein